jgi:serine/threonine protein kinase
MVELDNFRLLDTLGEGAAGRVHLATPRSPLPYAATGDPVALKCYKAALLDQPGQLERIRREFDVGATLAHPRLVRMLDYALQPAKGEPFLVMEYIDGIPLSSWITMFHPLPGSIVYRLCRQITEVIGYMHESGLVHRDIKPANIMVSNTLESKVMDLGVVRVTNDSWLGADQRSLTPDGATLGTVRNSSPEMLFGDEYDERADLYSLGTVLFALLHGEEVFESEHQWARLTQLVRAGLPTFDQGLIGRDQICDELGRLAKVLLEKEPDRRPKTAGDVLTYMDEHVAPLVDESEPRPIIHGYVATALTGLGEDSSEAMAFMSSSIAEVAKTYGIYVYQPRRYTDPLLHPDVDAVIVYATDRRRVASCDLLFLVANRPSFGVGQEVEIAAGYGKPTILIARHGTTISRMITGSFAHIIETIDYDTPEDLERKLRRCLRDNAETIRSWAETNRRSVDYGVGQALAKRRGELGYESAESFACAAHIPERVAAALEAGGHENVGLQMLGRVAAALEMDPCDLISRVRANTARPAADGEVSLRELETLARDVGMSASDYLRLRDEHRREIAASGSAAVVGKQEWGARFQAIERRRLADAGAEQASDLPASSQQRLL